MSKDFAKSQFQFNAAYTRSFFCNWIPNNTVQSEMKETYTQSYHSVDSLIHKAQSLYGHNSPVPARNDGFNVKQGQLKFKIFLRNRPVFRKCAASDSENDEKVKNRKRMRKDKTNQKRQKTKRPSQENSIFFFQFWSLQKDKTLTSGLYLPRSIHANIHLWSLTNDV